MKFITIATLFAAATSAKTHGKPIRVAYTGNIIFGKGTLDNHRKQVREALQADCQNIGGGANSLNGDFLEGYHIQFFCNCAHGNAMDNGAYVIRPFGFWSAQVTKAADQQDCNE
ncbi:hypothetical protein IL306_006283 [Fusarium sp. DS 682]|nr:hypothetical protein IL306_006283 [Fusarium sp. DS 682]